MRDLLFIAAVASVGALIAATMPPDVAPLVMLVYALCCFCVGWAAVHWKEDR